MRVHRRLRTAGAVLALGAVPISIAASTGTAGAEGTETLGPPTIAVASGTGMTANGIGMFTQPNSFPITVPLGATVKQVILYYEAGHREGDTSGNAPDRTIIVNGQTVTAGIIGGPTLFYNDVITSTHRADITSLGVVGPGDNTITVDGLDTDEVADGAGVVVIYDDGGQAAELRLVDGNDIAFVNFAPPRDATVPQTVTFAAADVARVATVNLLVNSVHDPVPAGFTQQDPKNRPNLFLVTVNGVTTTYDNPFDDSQGREFDSATIQVPVPAAATSVTMQMVSAYDSSGDLPASLVWLAAGVTLPVPTPPTTVTTTAPAVPTTAPPAVRVSEGALPFTGRDTTPLVVTALGAMTVGLALLVGVRRHPTQPSRS